MFAFWVLFGLVMQAFWKKDKESFEKDNNKILWLENNLGSINNLGPLPRKFMSKV